MPTAGAIESMPRLQGDLMLLGAGGKMGPTLARMARRASDAAGVRRRVIAVSRFRRLGRAATSSHRIEVVRCDLSDPASIKALPDAPNMIFMAGMKFGSTGNEPATWTMNVYVPGMVCEKFLAAASWPSRPAMFMACRRWRGALAEVDPPRPVGEYAMSALGRERIFEHFSRAARHSRRDPAIQLRQRTAVRRAGRPGAGGLERAADRPGNGKL